MNVEWTDAGDGYRFALVTVGTVERVAFRCPHDPGERWGGRLLPLNRETGWVIEQRNPLTLSPSIHCLECGCHGFIREGRWVPA